MKNIYRIILKKENGRQETASDHATLADAAAAVRELIPKEARDAHILEITSAHTIIAAIAFERNGRVEVKTVYI